MFIDSRDFEEWMQRIMERFDHLEGKISKPPEKERIRYNGELLLDNQDLCLMLHVCKRTLQRYRTLGWLPYKKVDQKAYYLESDVEKFIREHFEKNCKSYCKSNK